VRNPVKGAQFRRDVKLARKRGQDTAKLREVILLLIEGSPLPPRYKDIRSAATGSTSAIATSSRIGC
jgi:mRNA-degrading endonuclease YafQ of YafQ-DinJ toxin-antitoxin module